MDVSKSTTAPPEQQDGKAAEPARMPVGGLAKQMGDWAFDHKDTFQSEAGSLSFRNFARTLFAIVPYVFVSVGVQHFFQKTAEGGKNFFGKATPFFKHKITQNTANIAFSFTTFRSTSKIWNNNYDRIFGAKTKEDAEQAVHDLPGNIIKDAVTIVPNEFAATATTAVLLGATRTALKNAEPPLSQRDGNAKLGLPGGWKQYKEQYLNDWFANALGYSMFFEASDRLYSVLSKKHHNGAFTDGTLPKHRPGNNPDEKYDPFTEDTTARLVFRNGASVFMAALPFIATQRYANMKTGNYNPSKNSYMKDVAVGLASWEPSFAIFTTGIEAWQRKYDQLFAKLEAKYQAEKTEARQV